MFGHDSEWWTAFGAIAQAAGSLATFAAVAVSLWLARRETGLHGKGMVQVMAAFAGDGSPGTYLLSFTVENTGLRELMWLGTIWRVGWLSRGPQALRFKYAIQADASASPFVQQVIQPGTSYSWHIPIKTLKRAYNDNPDRRSFFNRRINGLGYLPIVAFANVSGRPPIKLKLSEEVERFLRTFDHADTTDG